jgi:hypothetical protein
MHGADLTGRLRDARVRSGPANALGCLVARAVATLDANASHEQQAYRKPMNHSMNPTEVPPIVAEDACHRRSAIDAEPVRQAEPIQLLAFGR